MRRHPRSSWLSVFCTQSPPILRLTSPTQDGREQDGRGQKLGGHSSPDGCHEEAPLKDTGGYLAAFVSCAWPSGYVCDESSGYRPPFSGENSAASLLLALPRVACWNGDYLVVLGPTAEGYPLLFAGPALGCLPVFVSRRGVTGSNSTATSDCLRVYDS